MINTKLFKQPSRCLAAFQSAYLFLSLTPGSCLRSRLRYDSMQDRPMPPYIHFQIAGVGGRPLFKGRTCSQLEFWSTGVFCPGFCPVFCSCHGTYFKFNYLEFYIHDDKHKQYKRIICCGHQNDTGRSLEDLHSRENPSARSTAKVGKGTVRL